MIIFKQQHEDNSIVDLPLPPPPSPTQLQQYENQTYLNTVNITTEQQQQQHQRHNQHTRTHSSLSSLSTGSNITNSSQSLSPIPYNCNQQQHNETTASTLSLDRFGSSPIHSRQTSSSSSSLGYGGGGTISGCSGNGGGGGLADGSNYISMPPAPPPPPLTVESDNGLCMNSLKQHHNNSNTKLLQKQNEYELNVYNKSYDGPQQQQQQQQQHLQSQQQQPQQQPITQKVYNKFLKEYSNKLLTQHNDTNTIGSNNNSINSNNSRLKQQLETKNHNINTYIRNESPKPFISPSLLSTPSPTNNTSVAAMAASLNNQLKFDSCQVVAPNASTSVLVSSSQVDKVRDSINSNCNSHCTTITNATNEMSTTMATMPSNITSADNGDKPFEYVTLTGNVIRSVVPPGKGANVNYKVSQGYVRPFGATPAATTPKSSVIYPPQPQQWSASAPPPAQPKPISNPYATLPRSNVGQQEPALKMGNIGGTLPNRKSSNALNSSKGKHALPTKTETLEHIPAPDDEATVMLSESIGKMNMGTKTNNFMIEAGKVISDMLEARLANGGPPLQSKTNLNSLSNNTSTSSRSPLVVRKRLDLDDFKDINPTEPAVLKPVGTLQQTLERNPKLNEIKVEQGLTQGINAEQLLTSHPMNKALDMCDNKSKPLSPNNNAEALQPSASIALTNADALPHSETVIYRNNGGSNRRASHATDRRSYIENNTQQNCNNKNDYTQDDSAFSICVKALGKDGTNSDRPMSAENEEVVSQLLKDGKRPMCCQCNKEITTGPFITALGRIWCPEHFICVNANCRRALQDIGFVEEKGDLYCEYCFEKYLAPTCSKCGNKIKGDCLNAIGKHFHPECFNCAHCGKLFGNTPFFLEDGNPYCEADWNELFTTKCFACGFPVEAGDRWVEALNHNYHSQCFNCTYCKQNLEGQSFYNKGGRPFCKNHAR